MTQNLSTLQTQLIGVAGKTLSDVSGKKCHCSIDAVRRLEAVEDGKGHNLGTKIGQDTEVNHSVAPLW